MFIQTEETPNPNVLKFLPGQDIVKGRPLEFKSKEEAKASPLAQQLFDVIGVQGVFLGSDFISITKENRKDWFVLKPLLLSTMIDALTNNVTVYDSSLDKPVTDKPKQEKTASEQDIINQIKELLETRVKPAVAQDGGDIEFFDYDDGIVYLEMRGACSGCPSSSATLKAGIENMLKYYIPEIQEVRPVNL